MNTIIKLNKKNGQTDAHDVLISHGFKIISSWFDNNRMTKDGITYKIAHPVWAKNSVRVEAV